MKKRNKKQVKEFQRRQSSFYKQRQLLKQSISISLTI